MQATNDDVDTQNSDLPQALRLIDEMNSSVKQVSDVVGSMLKRVKTGEISTDFGLSFLEVKYHMLLNYLINLTYVVLRKCSGMSAAQFISWRIVIMQRERVVETIFYPLYFLF